MKNEESISSTSTWRSEWMGVIWWGGMKPRRGRRKVLAISFEIHFSAVRCKCGTETSCRPTRNYRHDNNADAECRKGVQCACVWGKSECSIVHVHY
jgi:hypothetical protein